MKNNSILPLLGLCLRGGHLAVGEEPVESAARARDVRVLLLASDAAPATCRRAGHFSEMGQCIRLQLPCTKEELGAALGRSSVAIAAVTDIGLANAVVRRLAEQDPAQYEEAAGRLELKAKRAAQRRAEQLAHEKNLRAGRHRKKAPAEEPAAPSGKAAPEAPPSPRPAGERSPRHPGNRYSRGKSRPSKENRPRAKTGADRFANSRPVKKGKGSFRRKDA